MSTVFKALLTLIALWLVARSIDIDSAIGHLSQLSFQTVILVFALLFVQLIVVSERLRSVMAMLIQGLSYRVAFRATAEGNFFSHTFISVLGSDAARIWRCRRSGIPLAAATGGVMLDRLIGVTMSHIAMLTALPFLWARVDDDWSRSSLLLLAAGFTVGLGVVYLFGASGLPSSLVPRGRWARLQVIYDLSRVSRHAFGSAERTLLAAGYSLVVIAINVAIFYVLLKSLGARVDFIDCLLVVPIVIQISLLPISIGGWGVRETASVIGFGYFGVDGHIALAVSIAFGLLMLVFSLWGGIMWWMSHSEQDVLSTTQSPKPKSD